MALRARPEDPRTRGPAKNIARDSGSLTGAFARAWDSASAATGEYTVWIEARNGIVARNATYYVKIEALGSSATTLSRGSAYARLPSDADEGWFRYTWDGCGSAFTIRGSSQDGAAMRLYVEESGTRPSDFSGFDHQLTTDATSHAVRIAGATSGQEYTIVLKTTRAAGTPYELRIEREGCTREAPALPTLQVDPIECGERLMTPQRRMARVRLAGGRLIALVLVTPTLLAIPGVDEGPVVPFTYDVLSVEERGLPAQPSVDVHGDLVGIAWLNVNLDTGARTTEMLVRDATGETYLTSRPGVWWVTSAFDALRRYHVFTYTVSGTVATGYVTTWEAGTWSVRDVVTGVSFIWWPDSFVHDGIPHFLVPMDDPHTYGRIYRLNLQTDQWEILTELPFSVSSARAAADPEGRVHLLGRTRGSTVEKYSVYDNGAWQTSNAPFNAEWANGFDVATDSQGRPVFAYADSLRRPHVVLQMPNGSYVDELVTTQRLGSEPHVEVNQAGIVHLMTYYYTGSFTVPTQSNAYYHIRSLQGKWSTQPVLPIAAQLWPDMTLDDDGFPAIALGNARLQDFVGSAASEQVSSIVVARPAARHLTGVL